MFLTTNFCGALTIEVMDRDEEISGSVADKMGKEVEKSIVNLFEDKFSDGYIVSFIKRRVLKNASLSCRSLAEFLWWFVPSFIEEDDHKD